MFKFKLPKIRLPSTNTVDILVTIAGIGMIGIGLYMIYPPVMFIVIGIILAFPGMPRKEAK